MSWIKRDGEWELEKLLLEWNKSGHPVYGEKPGSKLDWLIDWLPILTSHSLSSTMHGQSHSIYIRNVFLHASECLVPNINRNSNITTEPCFEEPWRVIELGPQWKRLQLLIWALSLTLVLWACQKLWCWVKQIRVCITGIRTQAKKTCNMSWSSTLETTNADPSSINEWRKILRANTGTE